MASRIKISSNNDTTIINIKNGLGGRIKTIFVFEGVLMIGGALLLFLMVDLDGHDSMITYLLYLIPILMGIVFLVGAFRYLKKITEREILEIKNKSFIIRNISLFEESAGEFEIDKIEQLSFTGFSKYTDHPLKGESFDYLGFQTKDKQIQTVHEDGTISFLYESKIYSFGKRLPSWDAEIIKDAIVKATNNQLVISNLFEEDKEEFQ